METTSVCTETVIIFLPELKLLGEFKTSSFTVIGIVGLNEDRERK